MLIFYFVNEDGIFWQEVDLYYYRGQERFICIGFVQDLEKCFVVLNVCLWNVFGIEMGDIVCY